MSPRIVVAGTHSGVGKTTVATGLMAALAARGTRVSGAKVGPDFIDPSYHQVATGRPSRNLDPVLSGSSLVAPLLARGARDAEVTVVEGVMGLFDGAARTPEGEHAPGRGTPFASTAHVAGLVDAPVVLVVDAGAMAGSVAALVHGFTTFDARVRVGGVIANRVASDRHEALVREALEPLGVPVLGVLRRDVGLATPSRHLGLVPVAERAAEARRTVEELAGRVAAEVDLDAVMALARSARPLLAAPWEPPAEAAGGAKVRIGVAGGPAFSFTYTENLELLEAAGAELLPVDPTRDEALPEGIAGLYLGGGFPEAHGEALSANAALRQEVAALAHRNAPIIAECGGLLYLCRSLDGLPMCGVLDAEARMAGRLTLGYREARVATPGTWWPLGTTVRGHEFHHSAVEPGAGTEPAWRFAGDAGATAEQAEGFVAGRVHASYLHTHWARTPAVAARFVAAAARPTAGARA